MATGSQVPLWLVIVLPVISILIAATIGGAGLAPLWRKRRERIDVREERLDHAADAVLGCDADPARGRPAVRGLVDLVPELQQTLGAMNGKSVLDLVHDIDTRQRMMQATVNRLSSKETS